MVGDRAMSGLGASGRFGVHHDRHESRYVVDEPVFHGVSATNDHTSVGTPRLLASSTDRGGRRCRGCAGQARVPSSS